MSIEANIILVGALLYIASPYCLCSEMRKRWELWSEAKREGVSTVLTWLIWPSCISVPLCITLALIGEPLTRARSLPGSLIVFFVGLSALLLYLRTSIRGMATDEDDSMF